MADLTNLKAGDYISVLCESNGEKYECKVEEVVDGTGELRIHWHGFSRKDDFVLASDSSKIFNLNEATVLPPRPAKSKKTHDNDIWHETQEIFDESNESGKCGKCESSLQKECLNCEYCDEKFHLRCSEAPDYLLVRYITSETGYVCRKCVKSKLTKVSLKNAEETVSRVLQEEEEAVRKILRLETAQSEDIHVINNTGIKSKKAETSEAKKDSDRKPLCRKYRNGQCPHGLSGKRESKGIKKCPYEHPPRCYRYSRTGTCKWGTKCKYLHPSLCKQRKENCSKESCTLWHLKDNRQDNFRKLDASIGSSGLGTPGKELRVNKSRASEKERVPPSDRSPKNDQLERIEQMIFSMQQKYEEKLTALRNEVTQVQRGLFPPYNPWMNPLQMGNVTPPGVHQFPMSNPYSMPRSSS